MCLRTRIREENRHSSSEVYAVSISSNAGQGQGAVEGYTGPEELREGEPSDHFCLGRIILAWLNKTDGQQKSCGKERLVQTEL